MLNPNWSQEQRILRLRIAITVALILLQLSGLYRIPWWGFALLVVLGGLSLIVNRLGLKRHWQFLPSFNFLVDQLVTVFVLSLSEGPRSPLIFLCYVHLLSATVFFGQARVVIPVSAMQTINVAISTYLVSLWGTGPHYASAAVHIMGFLLIAIFLGQPASVLHQDALTDPLTGALNRRSGLRLLEAWLTKQPFNLIFADLKMFKAINDKYGHAVGDEVLKTVAQLLKTSVRQDDLVIRFGGDEFLTATRGEPAAVIKRLMTVLDSPIQTPTKDIDIDIDFGIARYPSDAASIDELIAFADEKMFASKRLNSQFDKTV